MVRCADCGLITRCTGNDPYPPDVEVGSLDRKDGTRADNTHGRKPLCTVQTDSGHDLVAEYDTPDDWVRELRFRDVIRKERECDCFLKYEGGTPSRHRASEKARLDKVEAKQEKAVEKAADRVLAVQDKTDDRGFTVGHGKAVSRRTFWYTVAGILVAATIGVIVLPIGDWMKRLFGPQPVPSTAASHVGKAESGRKD